MHTMVAEERAQPLPQAREESRIVFYDGECGLCTHSVKFLLAKDRSRRLQFASLQGKTAMECLPEELRDASDLSTMVYLTREGGQADLLTRSSAAAAALADVGGFWGFLGQLLRWVPKFIREPVYRFVAKRRMKFFPRGVCRLPSREEAQQLLD